MNTIASKPTRQPSVASPSDKKKAKKAPVSQESVPPKLSSKQPNPNAIKSKQAQTLPKPLVTRASLEAFAKQGLEKAQRVLKQMPAVQSASIVVNQALLPSVKQTKQMAKTLQTKPAKPPQSKPKAPKHTPLQKQLITKALADFRKMEQYNLKQGNERRSNETYLTMVTNNLKDGLFHLSGGHLGKGGKTYQEKVEANYEKRVNDYLKTLSNPGTLRYLEAQHAQNEATKALNQAKTQREVKEAKARLEKTTHEALQAKITGTGATVEQKTKALKQAQAGMEDATHQHTLGREAWNDGFKYVASATAGASVAMTGGAATPLWATVGGGIFVGGGTRIATERMDSHKGLSKKQIGKAFVTGGIDGGFGALAAGTNNIYQYAGTNMAWNATSRLSSMALDKEPQGGRKDALWREVQLAAPYALSDLITAPIKNPVTNAVASNTIGTWAYNELDTIERDILPIGNQYQDETLPKSQTPKR
jgi:hypothetical protein